jgi:hypothetical protein
LNFRRVGLSFGSSKALPTMIDAPRMRPMNRSTPKLHQRMAEDEIVMACDGLTMPEALGMLLKTPAQILADGGAMPGRKAPG